ncbi:tetratricopeptide repeat protein, partial [Microcystis aeruginosa]|uniref:tetratricopeptide repeat protein n=1 Tax=Microcystis aeruginosa TaxID=1126 RepID=UPI00147A9F43
MKIDEKNKNSLTGLAKAEASLGVIYSEENNYVLALQQYKIALKIYLELDDKKSISKAYNNIGVLYKSERNLAKALEYFSKALDIQEALKEPSVPVTLTNIGVIYFEQKQFQKASLYYDKALKAFSNLENFRGKALLFNYLGDLNRELKKLKVAEDYYNQSVSLSEKIEDKYVASLSLYQLGQLFYKQNQIDKALPLAEKSLQYAKLIGSLEQRYHSEKLVSDIQ